MLDPTARQRSAVADMQGTVALAQFLVIEDQDAFADYRSASERAVQDTGGQRAHGLQVDQVLAGGDMPYQAITVDRFPSGEAACSAFEAIRVERQAVLAGLYAVVVRPRPGPSRIAKALGFLAHLFSRMLGTRSEKEVTGFAEVANPETGPVPETIAVLREHDQTTPFHMMGLNKYYPVAKYASGEKVPGEQAYNRYGARILPYLASVGGYPAIMGHTVGVFVGDESSPLHDDWSDFAMVYYPSRRKFVRMMTNTPRTGVHHRDVALQRAVLMPSSDGE